MSVTTNKPRSLFTTITNAAFYEVLCEDAEENQTNWTVNRHAKPGDEVLLYVCAPVSAIVAIGTIETAPELCEDPGSEWFGSYFADIHSLVMLEVPLTREFLLAEFPEWRYWKQPRLSVLIPAEFAESLRQLITSQSARNDIFVDEICPGCDAPITLENVGGYKTFCQQCVDAMPPLPKDGHGYLIAEGCRYPTFRWERA